ncbi:uroporphyrinogen decarboxylase family protein [Staphylococcus aureus]
MNQAQQLGVTKTLQGMRSINFISTMECHEERLKPILDQGMENGKHIFNLGHGVFPEVQPETLRKVSEFVHTYTQR